MTTKEGDLCEASAILSTPPNSWGLECSTKLRGLMLYICRDMKQCQTALHLSKVPSGIDALHAKLGEQRYLLPAF